MHDDCEPKIKLPHTHPYLAKLTMDPADWHDVEQRFWDRPEVKVKHLDTSEPDHWTVFVACASETVKDLLEENW